ncbi:carboxypeptidase-like regulatory domain-containing protein [Pyxidicoccus sp. 3LFB2]
MTSLLRSALLCALLLSTASAAAEASGTLLGTVIDAQSRQPVVGARVTVTSGEPKVEATTVTDAHGNYRISQLPTGSYGIRFEGEGFTPFTRSGVHLRRPGRTIRVNWELMPETMKDVVEIVEAPPTIEVGAASMERTPIDPEFLKRIAVARPGPLRHSHAAVDDSVGSDRDSVPSWMLSRMPVLVPDGTPQLIYRAASAARWSPDFGP